MKQDNIHKLQEKSHNLSRGASWSRWIATISGGLAIPASAEVAKNPDKGGLIMLATTLGGIAIGAALDSLNLTKKSASIDTALATEAINNPELMVSNRDSVIIEPLEIPESAQPDVTHSSSPSVE